MNQIRDKKFFSNKKLSKSSRRWKNQKFQITVFCLKSSNYVLLITLKYILSNLDSIKCVKSNFKIFDFFIACYFLTIFCSKKIFCLGFGSYFTERSPISRNILQTNIMPQCALEKPGRGIKVGKNSKILRKHLVNDSGVSKRKSPRPKI